MTVFTNVSDPNAQGLDAGTSITAVNAISADGAIVAGYYTSSSGEFGFVEDDVTSVYTTVGPSNSSAVSAISADGETVAGNGFVEDVSAGVSTVIDGSATAISANGEIVAGDDDSSGHLGFVEDDSTGVDNSSGDPNAGQVGGQGTYIKAITADGGAVAGYYETSSYDKFGFVQDVATGVYTEVDDPNAVGTYQTTVVNAISADGTTVAGYYENSSYVDVGFVEDLATGVYTNVIDPNAVNYTSVIAISSDGEIVAGRYVNSAGISVGFVEDVATGVYTDINDPNAGQASGNEGTFVTSISSDGATVAGYYVNSANDDVGFIATDVACYGRGASILTDRGEIAVESLAVGDLVVTASLEAKPIKWIGRREVDCARHPAPKDVWPIRVSAGAFGEGKPSRDLWLSPGHNIELDGVLAPICALVNGKSVAQIERARIEYWHLELEQHDIVFAEGLPAETYLDTGNRTAFANGGAFIEAHPNFKPKHWAETCLPLVHEGPQVVRARARLLKRLEDLGHVRTSEADLHVIADGERIEPIKLGAARFAFLLPNGREDIRLTSRTFIPAQNVAESSDLRLLGVCVGRLQIDGEETALNDANRIGEGWRDSEPGGRWTQGNALLPAKSRVIVIDLAAEGYYWQAPTKENMVASFC